MRKVIIALVILCVCFGAFAQGSNEAKPEKIRVMLANHPYGNLIRDNLAEFEAQTGIKVEYEQLQEGQLSQQLTTEFTAGGSTVDVFMTRPLNESLLFLKNGWYGALDNYDFSDYPTASVDVGRKEGKAYIVPIVTEWQVMYYRKDLFKKAGIEVPKTFEELEKAAAILTADGVAGFGSRGAGNPSVTQLSSYIYQFGGRYIKNGEATFDSPEAIEAIKFYGKLLGNYGPQGVTSLSWEGLMPIFQAGKLAMWTDACVFYGQVIDPEKCTVPAEDIGIADLPAGPKGNCPFNVVSWGMAIYSGTQHKDAAEKFLEWATSKAFAVKGMAESITMARNSAWVDGAQYMNQELVASRKNAAENGYQYDRPFITSVGKARDLIGEVVLESINSKGTSDKIATLAHEKAAAVNEVLKADGEFHNLPY